MLTAAERNDLWNRSKNPDDFARAIERAVLNKLGEQAAVGLMPAQSTRFTSHDMASASAQGFRDGQAQAVPEWNPIESAPKDGTEVLVGKNYGRSSNYSVAWFDGDEWRDVGDMGWAGMDGEDNQPTHWKPLIPPPLEVE